MPRKPYQMSFEFKNTKNVLDQIARKIDAATEAALRKYADDIRRDVIRKIVDLNAVASGTMAKNIEILLTKTINKYIIKVINRKAPYMKFVDKGTRPHCAPIKPIMKWAALKFGGTPRAAYAIRASIIKKGTKKKPFLTMTLRQERKRAASVIYRYMRIALR